MKDLKQTRLKKLSVQDCRDKTFQLKKEKFEKFLKVFLKVLENFFLIFRILEFLKILDSKEI